MPAYRPSEQLWPYLDVPAEPTAEEVAGLDADLQTDLFGQPQRPFSITLLFSTFDDPDYPQAVALARASDEYREIGQGDAFRHRARFASSEARRLHELFQIVGRLDECEVLIDDKSVPYARELWLPLVWFLMHARA